MWPCPVEEDSQTCGFLTPNLAREGSLLPPLGQLGATFQDAQASLVAQMVKSQPAMQELLLLSCFSRVRPCGAP